MTPALTHWTGPARRDTGHIGILKLHIVPEPDAFLLLGVGAGVLVALRRLSPRLVE